MTDKITRREFLISVGRKAQYPLHLIMRLLALTFVAWVFVLVVQLLRGFTLHGWLLLGGLLLATCLLAFIRWLAVKLYGRFSLRGKALCAAVWESMEMITAIGIGILAWHKKETDDIASASVLIIALVVTAIQKGRNLYNQRIRKQAAA